MSKISRRNFLKGLTAAGAVSALTSLPPLLSAKSGRNAANSFMANPFPLGFDEDCFGASERILFEGRNKALVNVFVRPGRTVDIRLFWSDSRGSLFQESPRSFFSVKDSLDIPLGPVDGPDLFYTVEYKTDKSWKSHGIRSVKTPNVPLGGARPVKVILKGDDHVYADLRYEPSDRNWRADVLSGNYVTRMLREIMADPEYRPPGDEKRVVFGFTLAHTLKYILEAKPDLVIDVGDTVGTDSYRIWGAEGQWPELQPETNLETQARLLWERKRRTLAAITSEIPCYLALGNHEGETGWYTDPSLFTQPHSKAHRQRLFRQPVILHIPYRSNSDFPRQHDWVYDNNSQSYFPVVWANGDVRFLILDVNSYLPIKPRRIMDWTLGQNQKALVGKMLSEGEGAPWPFICFHNTLGGYPLGSGTYAGAYGRGPLFSRQDYERINEMGPRYAVDPEQIEQVWLTEFAQAHGVRGFFYGHDHVFFLKDIGKTAEGKGLVGACVGGTLYSGGLLPQNLWGNPYWTEFYGDYSLSPPSFFTPPGITELTIDERGATIRYKCTAPPDVMHANLPPGTKPGDMVYSRWLSRG
jgi:hypothetical protein